MSGGALGLWNHRSMQILVLLSLGLQLVLFVFAGIRRREASRVRRLLLWLAYLMADSTAIYAVGHMSLSRVARDHQLVAFWAPFLLLHLGGPDNITAYALQDNQLWLRHLQTLIVQVLGAAYVLKSNMGCCVGGGNLLPLASILMFAVGSVKYGERTWALKCGSLESISSSVQTQPPAVHRHFHRQDEEQGEEEFMLRRAHSMFHICKRAIVDSSVTDKDSADEQLEVDTTKMLDGVKLWLLMEIELSLMYDILYTKAAVIHSLFGYLVRVISPLTILTSLLLFHFSTAKDDGRHSADDVAITYVLLGGALFMETTSLLNALGSSWAFAFLCTTRWRWLRYVALCNGRWDRLRRAVVHLHHIVMGGANFRSRYKSRRRWSYTIGQYNMIHLCTLPAGAGSTTSPLLGRLAKMVGLGAWWNRKHYSGTIKISQDVKNRISLHIKRIYSKGRINSLGMLRKKWGEEPLDRRGLYVDDGILKESLGEEFQEGIIIWHIGTDVFLAKSDRAKAKDAAPIVEAIKVMSDYMMFLLVERPYMLPGLAQNRLYQRTCENLVKARSKSIPSQKMSIKNLFRLRDGPAASTGSSRASDREDLARNVYDEYESREFSHAAPRLTYVARLAKQLLENERDTNAGTTADSSFELLLDVWTDILVYAGNKCSRESHAKKLNSGGELTTILWLMAEHLYQISLHEAAASTTKSSKGDDV